MERRNGRADRSACIAAQSAAEICVTSLLEAIKRPGVRAAIATITVIAVSSTITFPLLTLLMEREGESRWSIGSNTALASFGILLAGPIWNRLLARIGAPNIMFVCLSLMTLCLVGFMLGYNYVIWCFLRFGLGVATGGLGSEGTFRWGGAANTQYFADPDEQVIGVILKQTFGQRSDDTRWQFKQLVFQAIDD